MQFSLLCCVANSRDNVAINNCVCAQIVDEMIKHQPHLTGDSINGWSNLSCCLERQNCLSKRKEWVPVAHPNVSMVQAYGLTVPLGNSNFLMEQYRHCKLYPHRVDVCP